MKWLARFHGLALNSWLAVGIVRQLARDVSLEALSPTCVLGLSESQFFQLRGPQQSGYILPLEWQREAGVNKVCPALEDKAAGFMLTEPSCGAGRH